MCIRTDLWLPQGAASSPRHCPHWAGTSPPRRTARSRMPAAASFQRENTAGCAAETVPAGSLRLRSCLSSPRSPARMRPLCCFLGSCGCFRQNHLRGAAGGKRRAGRDHWRGKKGGEVAVAEGWQRRRYGSGWARCE